MFALAVLCVAVVPCHGLDGYKISNDLSGVQTEVADAQFEDRCDPVSDIVGTETTKDVMGVPETVVSGTAEDSLVDVSASFTKSLEFEPLILRALRDCPDAAAFRAMVLLEFQSSLSNLYEGLDKCKDVAVKQVGDMNFAVPFREEEFAKLKDSGILDDGHWYYIRVEMPEEQCIPKVKAPKRAAPRDDPVGEVFKYFKPDELTELAQCAGVDAFRHKLLQKFKVHLQAKFDSSKCDDVVVTGVGNTGYESFGNTDFLNLKQTLLDSKEPVPIMVKMSPPGAIRRL